MSWLWSPLFHIKYEKRPTRFGYAGCAPSHHRMATRAAPEGVSFAGGAANQKERNGDGAGKGECKLRVVLKLFHAERRDLMHSMYFNFRRFFLVLFVELDRCK